MMSERPGMAFPHELAFLQAALDEAAQQLHVAKGSTKYVELATVAMALFQSNVSDHNELVTGMLAHAKKLRWPTA